jgi:hypothetical protein
LVSGETRLIRRAISCKKIPRGALIQKRPAKRILVIRAIARLVADRPQRGEDRRGIPDWGLIHPRGAAEFFQAFAALVPGLGIEDADVAALVERQAGAGLAPTEDVLRGSLDGARRLPEPGGLVMTCGNDAIAVGLKAAATALP